MWERASFSLFFKSDNSSFFNCNSDRHFSYFYWISMKSLLTAVNSDFNLSEIFYSSWSLSSNLLISCFLSSISPSKPIINQYTNKIGKDFLIEEVPLNLSYFDSKS